MFVQVIRGQAADPERLRASMDRWVQELAPGATGWLGSTAGVAESGEFFATARFESEEAARRNSDRPEQGEWWKETSQHLSGEATFHDSTEVDVDQRGQLDDAGFVQVINGRARDASKVRESMNQNGDEFAAFRPDVLGSLLAWSDDGAYTMVIYFRSEAEAREGEKKQPPPELAAQMDTMSELEDGEPTFLDLKDPWLLSPR